MNTRKTEKIDKRAAALRDNLKRRKTKAQIEKEEKPVKAADKKDS